MHLALNDRMRMVLYALVVSAGDRSNSDGIDVKNKTNEAIDNLSDILSQKNIMHDLRGYLKAGSEPQRKKIEPVAKEISYMQPSGSDLRFIESRITDFLLEKDLKKLQGELKIDSIDLLQLLVGLDPILEAAVTTTVPTRHEYVKYQKNNEHVFEKYSRTTIKNLLDQDIFLLIRSDNCGGLYTECIKWSHVGLGVAIRIELHSAYPNVVFSGGVFCYRETIYSMFAAADNNYEFHCGSLFMFTDRQAVISDIYAAAISVGQNTSNGVYMSRAIVVPWSLRDKSSEFFSKHYKKSSIDNFTKEIDAGSNRQDDKEKINYEENDRLRIISDFAIKEWLHENVLTDTDISVSSYDVSRLRNKLRDETIDTLRRRRG